ncbi:MAG: hypothetical protein GY696_05215 [Gammaproteobacteria bacterium]|nr:hypothetical protein [Gammaproteobacteria bacterium]
MPPDLQTDPDQELEELPLPADPDIEAHLPPPRRGWAGPPSSKRNGDLLNHQGAGQLWMGRKGTNLPVPGSRIDGTPIGPRPKPWQEIEEDLEYPGEQAAPLPDQDVWMEPEPGEQDEQMFLGSDKEPLKGSQEGSDVELEYQNPDPPGTMSLPRTRGWTKRQRDGQEPGEGARPGPHNQDEEEQPMDCQPAAASEKTMERNEGLGRVAGRSRSQAQAKQKKVTFLQAITNSQEFKSICNRRQDGTIYMEPANLARMCTKLASGASLPYQS